MAERNAGLHALLARPWVYDAVQAVMGAAGSRHQFLRTFLKARPRDRILDIGCGTAGLLRYLPEVSYIEPNAAYVETRTAR
jgi:SAM-dependent methyltransferase